MTHSLFDIFLNFFTYVCLQHKWISKFLCLKTPDKRPELNTNNNSTCELNQTLNNPSCLNQTTSNLVTWTVTAKWYHCITIQQPRQGQLSIHVTPTGFLSYIRLNILLKMSCCIRQFESYNFKPFVYYLAHMDIKIMMLLDNVEKEFWVKTK